MAENQQQNNYGNGTNTTGRSSTRSKGATVMPAKKKQVSTMIGESIVNAASKVASNIKNKNKINPA